MDLCANLNPQQRQAVLHSDGPVLIMAGAGSGKTRVLVHRIAQLLQTGQADPCQILAITFTNKAAREMRERIEKLMGADSRGMWVGTFHATCVRILRQENQHLDTGSNFVIYDDSDQQSLLKKCLKELNLDEKKFTPRAIGAAISQAKNQLWDPGKMATMAGDYFEKTAAEVYKLYQKKLVENNAMDFDDLIKKTVDLFHQQPQVLSYYQNRFRYILVDEYQDTNKAQYELIQLLAKGHRNLCVVGDPDQSIYRWRGADIQNILDFEQDYPEAAIIQLEQNYRSTGNILNAANAVIKHNIGRREKKLWTDQGAGKKICCRQTEDERAEALFIAETVFYLCREEDLKFSDFAVLYRTHAQSRAVEEACIKYKLPYRIFGGMKFYERKEIKDTLAYLKLIANPVDSLSLLRTVNEPKRGLGAATLERVEAEAALRGISLLEVMAVADLIPGISPRFAGLLKGFQQMIVGLIRQRDQVTVSQLVRQIWEASGYERALQADKSPEAEGRLENLKEFLSVTEDFDRSAEEPNLENFLAQISLTTDMDNAEESEEKITLMTLHSAKGLEFPVVFLVGLEEGVFPHGRAMLDNDEMEEERRLCYVGMTRAQKRLFLTRSYQRMLWGRSQYNQESRFIREIDPSLLTDEVDGTESVCREPARRPSLKSPASPGSPQPVVRPKGEDLLITLGDKVQHAKFGSGVVVKTSGSGEDMEVSIAFPGQGIKTLIMKYAPIKKI